MFGELICVKQGVELNRLTKPMLHVIDVVIRAWEYHAPDITPFITSGSEKVRRRIAHSLHYKGLALDFRTKNLTDIQLNNIVRWLKMILNDAMPPDERRDYDIVVKPNHVHIEHQPK